MPESRTGEIEAIRAELSELREIAAMRRELAAIKADLRWQRFLRALKAYNPNQPRVPAGNPDGGQWTDGESGQGIQIAGTVIRICIAGSRSLITDSFGNKSYWVEYLCAGGRTFTRSGSGHYFRAIMIDPFK